MKQDLIALAKKHKFYYSIYPSFLSEKNKNKKDLKIKLFTDLSSPNNYSILPVRFCPLRNCHVFDIPKKKFLSHKKIMNFNFLNHNKVVIDPKYKIVLFGEDYVNQIDFKKFDKKEKFKNNYFKITLNKIESSGTESGESNSYSDYEDDSKEKKEKNLNENLDINDCLNHNIINFNKNYNNKLENDCVLSNTLSNSTKDSFSLNSPIFKKCKKKRSKSILKNKNGSKSKNKYREKSSNSKRVSFGFSQISFYKAKLFK